MVDKAITLIDTGVWPKALPEDICEPGNLLLLLTGGHSFKQGHQNPPGFVAVHTTIVR